MMDRLTGGGGVMLVRLGDEEDACEVTGPPWLTVILLVLYR